MYCCIHRWNSLSFLGPTNRIGFCPFLAFSIRSHRSFYRLSWRYQTKRWLTILNHSCVYRWNKVRWFVLSFRISLGQCFLDWCYSIRHFRCLCFMVFLLHIWFERKWIINKRALLGFQISFRINRLRCFLDRPCTVHSNYLWVLP